MLTWLIEQLPTVKRLRAAYRRCGDDVAARDVELVRARRLVQHLQHAYKSEIIRNLEREGHNTKDAETKAMLRLDVERWAVSKRPSYGEQIGARVEDRVDIGECLAAARQRGLNGGDALTEARHRDQEVKP